MEKKLEALHKEILALRVVLKEQQKQLKYICNFVDLSIKERNAIIMQGYRTLITQ